MLKFGSLSCDKGVELGTVWLVPQLMLKWLLEVLESLFIREGMQLSLKKGNQKREKKIQ